MPRPRPHESSGDELVTIIVPLAVAETVLSEAWAHLYYVGFGNEAEMDAASTFEAALEAAR